MKTTIMKYGVLGVFVALIAALALSCSATDNLNSRFATLDVSQITATHTEINALDGITPTVTELNYINGTVLGTTVSGSALGIGTSRDINYLVVTDSLVTNESFILKPFLTSDLADSSLVVKLVAGGPVIDFFGSDDDNIRLSINTSDQLQISDASAGLSFRMSYLSDLVDSALVFGIPAGIPTITTYATDDDTGTITANTSDQLVFTGYSGGIDFAVTPLVGATRVTEYITAANVLTAAESGLLSVYVASDAKYLSTLPAAAAGLEFSFYVADADSAVITVASAADSLYDIDGAAYATMTSVAGHITVMAANETQWVVTAQNGTWTSYVQAP